MTEYLAAVENSFKAKGTTKKKRDVKLKEKMCDGMVPEDDYPGFPPMLKKRKFSLQVNIEEPLLKN